MPIVVLLAATEHLFGPPKKRLAIACRDSAQACRFLEAPAIVWLFHSAHHICSHDEERPAGQVGVMVRSTGLDDCKQQGPRRIQAGGQTPLEDVRSKCCSEGLRVRPTAEGSTLQLHKRLGTISRAVRWGPEVQEVQGDRVPRCFYHNSDRLSFANGAAAAHSSAVVHSGGAAAGRPASNARDADRG